MHKVKKFELKINWKIKKTSFFFVIPKKVFQNLKFLQNIHYSKPFYLLFFIRKKFSN